METRPLMIDVDTGVDDATALALAFGLRANLVGISTVAGNVPIERSTDNTLRVLSFLGQSGAPVFRGASRPLVAPYQDAVHIHGEDGLGGAEFPESAVASAEMTGPEAIITMADRYEDDLTLVMVGPLTNLAIALSLRPEITRQIARLVIMGGAYFTGGNVTELAEFNIFVDPDAANQVFAADWEDVTAIGLDVTHQTALTRATWEQIPADDEGTSGLMRMVAEQTFTRLQSDVFYLHDPLAIAVALDPSLVSGRRYGITVATDGEQRGRTTVSGDGKVLVASEVNARTFIQRFQEALGLPESG